MGTKATKPKQELRKFDLEVTSDKIYQHLIINRDRRINELATRERDLRDAIKAGRKSYEDVLLEMISIVNLFKYIKAAKMILRYCLILKDHSMQICEASRTKNMASIWELETYFQGLIWASDKLNLTYIKEFNKLIFVHFGPEIFKEMQYFTKVDKELKQCFGSIEPSPNEVKDYLEKFCARYDIKDFGFGGKKETPQPKDGGQKDQKTNEDLDAMFANLKIDLDNTNNINGQGGIKPLYGNNQSNQFYPNNFVQPGYDPTSSPINQNQGYNLGYQQPGNNFINPPPGYNPYPLQPNFQQPGNNNDLPAPGFSYPENQPKKSHQDQDFQAKLDEMNNFGHDNQNNNYNDLGDDHIRDLIELNIKKSYNEGVDPTQPPAHNGNPEQPKEDVKLSELISRLKELGVTLPEKKISEIHYDAQKHYKNSNLNVNDYKIDFDLPSPKNNK